MQTIQYLQIMNAQRDHLTDCLKARVTGCEKPVTPHMPFGLVNKARWRLTQSESSRQNVFVRTPSNRFPMIAMPFTNPDSPGGVLFSQTALVRSALAYRRDLLTLTLPQR
jgi:hypothetical protein